MNVLFLNPPFIGKFSREQRSPAITKSGTIYFPMWLAYCAGYIESHGFKIDLIDCPAADYSFEQILSRIKTFAPKVAVIVTSTPSIYNDVEIAVKLKNIVPNLITVLVGPHVSVMDKDTLETNVEINAVARREYEETVLELCQAVRDNRPFSSIKGLTYRENGEIVRNVNRPFIKDLDKLPFVSKTYNKFLNYKHYFSSIALYPQVTIITGRGCPYACKFCVYPQTQMGQGYRFRKISIVLDEIEYILNAFPEIEEIFFEDDTLTANKNRCIDFCNQIKQRNLKFSWTANSRADIDLETLQAMKSAGCRLLCVGIESGNQKILDNIGKQLTLEQIRNFFRDSKLAGILIHGCFMVGNPGETANTMKQTLKFAMELKPDTSQFFPIMVYPGTKTYLWAHENNYLETHDFRKWLTEDGLHNCVVNTPELSSNDLVTFCNDARRKFYLRPSYILSKIKQILSSKAEMRRTFKSAMTFKNYILKKK